VRGAPLEQWGERIDSRAALPELLAEAQRVAGEAVSVIAVDMPVALEPVRHRRCCDKAISVAFGARWCSTHSPTQERPGTISDVFYRDAVKAGFSLRTTSSDGTGPALLEVYPHVALLALCGSKYRLPYKLSKRRNNFPALDPGRRLEAVNEEWNKILGCLKARIDMDLEIACAGEGLRCWKAWEDVLDAIVCCWVGLEWLSDRAEPYGDSNAAIWVPAILAKEAE
jgi:predicted RNase H-like nuclease